MWSTRGTGRLLRWWCGGPCIVGTPSGPREPRIDARRVPFCSFCRTPVAQPVYSAENRTRPAAPAEDMRCQAVARRDALTQRQIVAGRDDAGQRAHTVTDPRGPVGDGHADHTAAFQRGQPTDPRVIDPNPGVVEDRCVAVRPTASRGSPPTSPPCDPVTTTAPASPWSMSDAESASTSGPASRPRES